MDLTGVLVRLLIGVLVYFLGEKVIALVKNADLQSILTVVLIIVVVIYVVFGASVPLTIR